MDTDSFLEPLREEIKARLDSADGMNIDRNFTGAEYLKLVFRSLDGIGLKVVSKEMAVFGEPFIQDFARSIIQWNSLELEPQMTEQDVNPGQIIQALQSDGWTIIPPGA